VELIKFLFSLSTGYIPNNPESRPCPIRTESTSVPSGLEPRPSEVNSHSNLEEVAGDSIPDESRHQGAVARKWVVEKQKIQTGCVLEQAHLREKRIIKSV
jgi:hypothetical protein